ncbi:MAG: transcriptional regulator [Thermotogae bacterium]|uniref:ArsR/SmtB family transcription factor n=1 Tax=Kosmotoga sp. TaxID=1955248 RepID=UPI000F247031|nr:metalloregulator ArsR/SmtB family transcription factor [Kosmotoga sp.]RKX48558.1 MAG: transcriptional regulator [Thermotogota bacterium]
MPSKRVTPDFDTEHRYYQELADFFSVFVDPTRLKILHVLMDGEKCVKKISELVGLNQSACSHQLRTLKHHGLVKSKREGKFIRYSICDEHISEIIEIGSIHIGEKKR